MHQSPWSILLYFISPETIVSYIGIKQGYLLAFFIALIAGVSTLTSASFYTTIITLASGGLNPILLGIVAGIGLTISDSIFYYFGVKGREVFSEKINRLLDRLTKWLEKRPDYFIPSFIFFYAILPLPSDILMIIIAFSNYPFKKILVPLVFGNIIAVIILSTLFR